MKERTFTLSKVFTEIFFERFSQTLEHLKSGDGSYSEATGKLVEPYTKVTVEDIAAFIESAFWASVTAEEGRYHGFHVSLGPPNEYPGQYSWDYLFSLPRAYSPREISALAPVLAKNYKRVGVWYSSSGSLEIWGIADVAYWPVEISTSGPGQLLFSMLGGVNSFDVAISGSWWGFVDKTRVPITWAYLGGTRPDNPLELDPETVSKALRRSRAYESIAKSMLQHGHGGTLIIVPEDHETWRRSLASIKYEGSVFQKIRGDVDEWDTALHREQESGRFMHDGDTERARQSAIESLGFVAQLTAVDGATLLGRDLAIYGFGVKLQPLNSNDRPKTARRSRPFEDAPYYIAAVPDLGGTRHQSAAQFVYDQKDCVAIVCSQDGRLSALSWDAKHECIQVITNLEYAL